jgi:hypothetical protein
LDLFNSPSYIEKRHTFDSMKDYLMNQSPATRPPSGLINELDHVLQILEAEAEEMGDSRSASFMVTCRHQLIRNKVNGLKVLQVLENLLSPRSSSLPIFYSENRLENKIANLEREIVRLSSNPEFEEKMSKLEGELESIRALKHDLVQPRADSALEVKVADLAKKMQTFLISSEDGEKKFEDMLKVYKSAKTKIFVIMPFAAGFDDVWRGGIERACSSAEHMAGLRVDEIRLSTWITEDIKEYISMADVVIADITGSNPNVMFELGWALASQKEPIVVRQQDDPVKVPFDVHGIRYIPYLTSWSGIERLHREICKFLKATEEAIAEKKATKERTKSN